MGCKHIGPDVLTSEHNRLQTKYAKLLQSSLKLSSNNIDTEMNVLFMGKIREEFNYFSSLNDSRKLSDVACQLAIEKYKSGMSTMLGSRYIGRDKLASGHYKLQSEIVNWLLDIQKSAPIDHVYGRKDTFLSTVEKEFKRYHVFNNTHKPLQLGVLDAIRNYKSGMDLIVPFKYMDPEKLAIEHGRLSSIH
jgi:hypothetical protein